MFNMKIKMKFVELKGAGLPMYKIAEELGVHRTTLTLWNKELAPYILIAKQDVIDELLYDNGNMKINRIEILSRNLAELYHILDNEIGKEGCELTLNEVMDLITTFTKLLRYETCEKSMEQEIMRYSNKNANKNEKKNDTQMTEEDKKDETPLWITDMESFRRYQSEEESEEANENLNNARETEPDTTEMKSDLQTCRDVSEEDPEVRKILMRTHKRKNALRPEKPVKNSSKRKIKSEEKIAERKEEQTE